MVTGINKVNKRTCNLQHHLCYNEDSMILTFLHTLHYSTHRLGGVLHQVSDSAPRKNKPKFKKKPDLKLFQHFPNYLTMEPLWPQKWVTESQSIRLQT